MKEKTLQFNFNIQLVAGKENLAADALSRYPVGLPDSEDEDFANDVETTDVMLAAVNISHGDGCLSTTVDRVKKAAAMDPQYQLLVRKVNERSFAATQSQEDKIIQPFYNIRNRLFITHDLLMYKYGSNPARIVIPQSLRRNVIDNLHVANQGAESIQSRARHSVYWPKIDDTILEHCQRCEFCKRNAPSQHKEPMILTSPPEYPFQKVVADLFSIKGRQYIAYACRLTGWLEIACLKFSATSKDIIEIFQEIYHRFGIPEEISLDGGPNLDSKECLDFLRKWGVERRLSSAYYPQSNGRAEAAVKTSKRLIKEHVGNNAKI